VNDTASNSRPNESRAHALDALRGLAILAMLLSSELPFGANSLPSWMYHAQVPPPDHQFLPVPGITWVDLVFPFFLFSMGASFPLALGRRLRSGASEWSLAGSILKRGLLLGFFALFVADIRPEVLNGRPSTGTWLAGLAGFLILFPILTRLPRAWKPALRWTIRLAGWAGAIVFLALARYPDGQGFRLERSDIIIVVLTNMAVFGALIWLLTRNHLLPRLGIIGILLAIRLSNMPHPLGGWVTAFWDFSPAPWIYKLYYLQYLCIVLPGTVAGELLDEWSRRRSDDQAPSWSAGRTAALALLMFAFMPVLLAGLKSRWLPGTPLVVFGMLAVGWPLVKSAVTPTERLYKSLFLWAVYWMTLGLILESYEGGIRKDKATVSYYFVTTGLAHGALMVLSIVIDVFKRGRWLGLFIQTGQNPMIAYAGVNNFIVPCLALTGLAGVLDQWAKSPWRGFWRGVLVTLLMGLAASFLTRRKIFWRT
jgi:predicted acyltransferase